MLMVSSKVDSSAAIRRMSEYFLNSSQVTSLVNRVDTFTLTLAFEQSDVSVDAFWH